MTLQRRDHLIIGGSAAATAAALTLRLEDAACDITMLSAENLPPYYRPALSKQFLLGDVADEQILLHPAEVYAQQRIDLHLNCEIVAVDPANNTVCTKSGDLFRYDQLLIATGTQAIRLPLPGADLPGVHHLRYAAECTQLRKELDTGVKHAVVLGASFLGMEIALSLVERGLHVTVIEQRDGVLPHVESRQISEYFRRHAEQKGTTLLLSDTITAIHGAARIREVETASGLCLPCDLLIISIGVTGATGFLHDSGIQLEDGLVVVDEQLRTNLPNIYAAGDVTSFYDPVFRRRRHIEHWDNAIKQGRLAARNMLGQRLRYDEVSYFFCDIGDISFSMLGAPEDADEQIARGTLAAGSFALFYLKNDIPRALLSVGRPVEETRSVEGLIRYRVNLSKEKDRLADPDFALDQIPTQTVLVLQGGGAMGAFECGIVKALEEEQIYPDIVAGISIGALNGAIVAGNPRHATEALQSFWSEITVASPRVMNESTARMMTALEILSFGVPNFFQPRWLTDFFLPTVLPIHWNSFYDVAPMKKLIARYVDFSKLRASPVRLLVGAVNVRTGLLEIFDSYADELTPDHVLASGSLPPGFPWTEINGEAYWDGGIVSNSPLDMVIDRCGPDGKRVYVVDLFSGQRQLPTNMIEVMARRDEIAYSERVHSDLRWREKANAYRYLINSMLDNLPPDAQARIRQRPLYIELMGDGSSTTVTRFVRQGQPGEPSSRDYDFSDIAIRENQENGYALAKQTLRGGVTFAPRRQIADATQIGDDSSHLVERLHKKRREASATAAHPASKTGQAVAGSARQASSRRASANGSGNKRRKSSAV